MSASVTACMNPFTFDVCIIYLKRLAYAHDGGKVVLGGGRDLQTGLPDVQDGGAEVAQLRRDGPLVHCTRRHGHTVVTNTTSGWMTVKKNRGKISFETSGIHPNELCCRVNYFWEDLVRPPYPWRPAAPS